jgi:hypothetical protein
MRRRHRVWLAVAVVALVCLAGCGREPAAPSPRTITSVSVLRTSAFPANHIPPFERRVTDATQARQLYTLLWALPEPPQGNHVYACPADFGVQYHLTFSRGATPTPAARATVNAGGCSGVTLFGGRAERVIAGGPPRRPSGNSSRTAWACRNPLCTP